MKYHPHPSFPGYGWLEPFSDADMPLIEEEFARDIIAAFDALREESDARKALINLLRAEIDALRAKIEAMGKQEPVGKFIQHPSHGMWEQDGYGDNPDAKPLYALPGAQTQGEGK